MIEPRRHSERNRSRDERDDLTFLLQVGDVQNKVTVGTQRCASTFYDGAKKALEPRPQALAVSLPCLLLVVGVALPVKVGRGSEHEIDLGRVESFSGSYDDIVVRAEPFSELPITFDGRDVDVRAGVVHTSSEGPQQSPAKACAGVPHASARRAEALVNITSNARTEDSWRSTLHCNCAKNALGVERVSVPKLETDRVFQNLLVRPCRKSGDVHTRGSFVAVREERRAETHAYRTTRLDQTAARDMGGQISKTAHFPIELIVFDVLRKWEGNLADARVGDGYSFRVDGDTGTYCRTFSDSLCGLRSARTSLSHYEYLAGRSVLVDNATHATCGYTRGERGFGDARTARASFYNASSNHSLLTAFASHAFLGTIDDVIDGLLTHTEVRSDFVGSLAAQVAGYDFLGLSRLQYASHTGLLQTELSGMGSDLSARRTDGLDLCRSTLCPYWRRSSLQAPTELQNYLSSYYVTITNKATRAVVYPLTEAFLGDRAALRTGLTGETRIYFHDCTTSILSFFAQPAKEVTKSSISERFRKRPVGETFDRQRLYEDGVVARNERVGDVDVVFASDIRDVRVLFADEICRLSPAFTSTFPTVYPTKSSSETYLRSAQWSGVSEDFAITGCNKLRQSHVDADITPGLRQRARLNVDTSESDVPSSTRSDDAHGLGLALDGAVHSDLHLAKHRYSNTATTSDEEFSDTCTLEIVDGDSVPALRRLEAGVAGCVSFFATSEKIFESFVDAIERPSEDHAWDLRKFRSDIFYPRKLTNLIEDVGFELEAGPSVSAIFECSVVEFTSQLKPSEQGALLSLGRFDLVAKRTNHKSNGNTSEAVCKGHLSTLDKAA